MWGPPEFSLGPSRDREPGARARSRWTRERLGGEHRGLEVEAAAGGWQLLQQQSRATPKVSGTARLPQLPPTAVQQSACTECHCPPATVPQPSCHLRLDPARPSAQFFEESG